MAVQAGGAAEGTGSAGAGRGVVEVRWEEVQQRVCEGIIPPLEGHQHKGQMGRVGVLGGSPDYSGAPYYAATSALKFVVAVPRFAFHIFGLRTLATTPIKCYSPELMVTGVYDSYFMRGEQDEIRHFVEKCTTLFPRLHVLVIGPGLGRDERVMNATAEVVARARAENKLLVIDADGLYMLQTRLDLLTGYKRVVLTPNAVEFERLWANKAMLTVPDPADGAVEGEGAGGAAEANGAKEHEAEGGDSDGDGLDAEAMRVTKLSQLMGGVTILRKGAQDIISNGQLTLRSLATGSPRRVGGQGDVLSGCVATAMHWAHVMTARSEQEEELHDADAEDASIVAGSNHLVWAALTASVVTKKASTLAYAREHRAMTAPDVLDSVGQAFEMICPAPSAPSEAGSCSNTLAGADDHHAAADAPKSSNTIKP